MKLIVLMTLFLMHFQCYGQKKVEFLYNGDSQPLTEIFKDNSITHLQLTIPKNDQVFVFKEDIFTGSVDYGNPQVEFKDSIRLLPNISQMKQLESLKLNNTGIEKLPEGIETLSNLTELDISITKVSLADELEQILNIPNLKKLSCYFTPITNEDELAVQELRDANIEVAYRKDDLLVQDELDKVLNPKRNAWNLKERIFQFYNHGNLLREKLKAVDEGDRWIRLVGELQQAFPPKTVTSFHFLQQPAYNLNIHIARDTMDHFIVQRTMYVGVSKVEKVFTSFYTTSYWFLDFRSEDQLTPTKKIVHNDKYIKQKVSMTIPDIKVLVKEIFWDYSFVSFEDLFYHKIKGLAPMDIDQRVTDEEYILYNYLFDPYFTGFEPFR